MISFTLLLVMSDSHFFLILGLQTYDVAGALENVRPG